MMKTIRLTYDRKCPDCVFHEGKIDRCPKHWAEIQRLAATKVDEYTTAEEALYRLLVEGSE